MDFSLQRAGIEFHLNVVVAELSIYLLQGALRNLIKLKHCGSLCSVLFYRESKLLRF